MFRRFSRPFYVLGALFVCALLYNFSQAHHNLKRPSTADARLARWLETVVAPGDPFKPSRAYDPPGKGHEMPKANPKTPFDPFPLGTGTNSVPIPTRTAVQKPKSSATNGPRPMGQVFPDGNPPLEYGGKETLKDLAGQPAVVGAHSQPQGDSFQPGFGTAEDVQGLPNPRQGATGEGAASKGKDEEDAEFNQAVFSFQWDIQNPQPRLNLSTYKDYKPHNYQGKPGFPTFATFLCTPNSSIHDPYFAATQNLVYRNLWSPTSSSKHYPFTVFVAPFICQEQRDLLAGAGAIVRELELVDWEPPNAEEVWSRWKDLFTKIHMWNQTDFSRIAFMDSDAFPIKNIDDIFDRADPQRCIPSKLTPEDAVRFDKGKSCSYVFAGVEIAASTEINVGMIVLQPDPKMHARLMENYVKTDQYNTKYAEQAFLNWQFNLESAFPPHFLPRAYNGFFPQADEENSLKVVHEKLWVKEWELVPWVKALWNTGWEEMVKFYDSEEFKAAREKDNQQTS